MDFLFRPEEEVFRQEVRDFLKQELPADHWHLQNDRETTDQGPLEFRRAFVKKMGERGWLNMAWPKEYGGQSATHMRQLVFNEEMSYHKAPGGGGSLVGAALIHHGSEEQRKEYLPPIASGDVAWCQGFSEPGSGSDLASLQTRAVHDGDEYVINGQKIWTSGGHEADWCFALVRTDPDAPKHRGISFVLVNMRSPGVEVRPLINMLGTHKFNELYFTDVRIPRDQLVGEENRGWYVAATTLDYERSGIQRVMWGKRILEEMCGFIRSHPEYRTESVRHQIANYWISMETSRMLSYRVTSMQQAGLVPNYEASMSKMFGSEWQKAMSWTGISMIRAWGNVRRGGHPDTPLLGAMAETYMATSTYTISQGTSEIQRNVIATRGLGLPRG